MEAVLDRPEGTDEQGGEFDRDSVLVIQFKHLNFSILAKAKTGQQW